MRVIDADALVDAMTGACNIFDAHGVDTTIARTLITVAAKAPTIGGWISVKDRMPPNDGTKVLTYGNPVTHWMPLPEPPKEETNDG